MTAMKAALDLLTLTCVGINDETPTIRTFHLRAATPVKVTPGQALVLHVPLPSGAVWRTFTVSGTQDNTVALTIKAQGMGKAQGEGKAQDTGGATRWLHDTFTTGQTIAARGPVGRFTLDLRTQTALAFVSGGSGATPMLAMLTALAEREPGSDVVWFHAAHDPAEILFPDALRRLQCRMPNLRVVITASHSAPGWFGLTGRATRAMIAASVPDFGRRQVFCCGPEGFMRTMRLIHAAEGGDKALFHTESFGGAPQGTQPPAPAEPDARTFRMTIAGREIAIRPDETVLQASLRHGVIIPCGCGQGMCGTCMVRLTSGQIETAPEGGISAEEQARGYILACSTRAVSDISVSI